ncbi:MAG TPA: lytic transglycosylase domain-containing protein, partial [Alphaproteobacteria bacterium]|nr:lytic transglycosylase domain-containing protein [Alphaproteobacteria bacterium]
NQNLTQIKLLAALALEINRPDLALSAARIAYSQGAIFLNYLYPVYFKQFIGQEPAIILAIIRQESSFNPLIVSDKGAHGVMQLLPSTAKGVAKQLSVAYQRSKLFQPDYNIKLGKQYLLGLLTRWERSYILAIASYNAGPGNVKNWIDTFGDPRDPSIDPILWIENIPFAETRNYVQRVLEAAEVYRYRLNPQNASIELENYLHGK